MVIGSISDVDSWNEYLSRQSFSGNLLRRIFLRLAEAQGNQNDQPQDYRPQLAESWRFGDGGLSLTFTLRDVGWSDGQPLTASDVRFTWLAQTSDDVPWAGAEAKERITDVEVLDPRRVRFHFDGRYPYQLEDAVEGGILPEHIFSKIPFEEWATHDWSTQTVGSGPFLLHEHQPGHQITLVRNPRYYEPGRPLLDRVVVRIVPDIGNLLTQVLAGEVDYLEGIPAHDAHRLAARLDVNVLTFDYPKFDYIGWNGSRPPFDDPELRRALTLAIDREALVDDLLYGYGRVSKGPLLSFWWSADSDLAPLPYDPEQARRILNSRGYRTVDAAGNAPSKGETLSFALITNTGNRLREDVLVKIQEQLSRIGVRVEVRAMEMRALRQKAASGEYDGYIGGWTFFGKVDLEPIFGSESLFPAGMNVVHYRSGQVDELFDELDRAQSWQAMKPTLDRIQQLIAHDQPYTFLYEPKRVAVHGPRLHGVEIEIPADPLARLESFWVN